MSLEILKWPDRRLRTPCEAIDQVTPEVHRIWDDMIQVMEEMPGVGLAANQIGVMLRLAVVDASETRGRAIKMANPEILHASKEQSAREEASPCLPGASGMVKRPAKVAVRFINEMGMIDRRDYDGLWATSVQHQIDHLNGKMYFHRMSRVKRDMLLKKALKQR